MPALITRNSRIKPKLRAVKPSNVGGLRDGLVVHLPLWEGVGAPRDISAGAIHPSFVGSSVDPTWITSTHGLALSFDGSNDYLSFGDVLDFQANTSFAVSWWFRTSDDATGQAWPGVWSKEDSKSTPRQGYLSVLSTTGSTLNYVTFALFVNDSGQSVDTGRAMNDGLWHHYVGQRDIRNSLIQLWLDGILVASDPLTNSGNLSNSTPLMLGARNYVPDAKWCVAGDFSDYRIYNRTLTPAEVRTLYQHPFADLYLDWWNFPGWMSGAGTAPPAGNAGVRHWQMQRNYPLGGSMGSMRGAI